MSPKRQNPEEFSARVEEARAYIRAAFPLDWKKQTSELCRRFINDHALRDKSVAYKTRANRFQVIFSSLYEIRNGGFKIKNIYNFSGKHIQYLVSQWEAKGNKPSTLQSDFSIIKLFASWLGKEEMVKPLATYLRNKEAAVRSYIAVEDKGWKKAGVDIDLVIAEVDEYDPYVAMQLKMIKNFGFRKKEAVCFTPWLCLDPSGLAIQVYDGTKGGRYRVIPITKEEQKIVLDEAKKLVHNRDAHIGRPGKTLVQNMRRLQYIMEKEGITKAEKGVTLHGVRHDFANDQYEEGLGEPSPVRGGSLETYRSENGCTYRLHLAKALGHARIQITGAYTGGRVKSKKK